MRTVLITAPTDNTPSLFTGWDVHIVSNQLRPCPEPDLIVFTGGSDVTPSYYHEEQDNRTVCNPKRDFFEDQLVRFYEGVPMVGICRGAQFLNVIKGGGKLRQHIDGHGMTTHPIMNKHGMVSIVNSDHHQEILLNEGEWLYKANDGVVEAFWIPEKKVLGVQWHPEWGHTNSLRVFDELLSYCLNIRRED